MQWSRVARIVAVAWPAVSLSIACGSSSAAKRDPGEPAHEDAGMASSKEDSGVHGMVTGPSSDAGRDAGTKPENPFAVTAYLKASNTRTETWFGDAG